ncbi:hypothetical protein [Ancylobacter radicis]|uniref:YfhO family protein n=1 Tax=Ancylobacter radicis TaxID=2836179 RepID=A0ABS5RBM7_9HYPH|nr:hypothetical protein [Ancylobacter radicis]MBS9478336.1 hypothetical protein [Ancylobacter radicis]
MRGSGFIIAALSLVATGIFYLPYLTEFWSISPWHDTIYLTGPLFCEISRSVNAGVVPLMNWSTFEAIDYNAHVAPYYPFYFFNWLNFCSASDAAQAADIISVVHLGILLLTTTSLIRVCGTGLAAALVGGAIASTLPNTLALTTFPTLMAAAAWLPLAIEGLIRIYYRRQYGLGAILLAAGTGAMLTAGPGTNLLSALVFTCLILTAHLVTRLLRQGKYGAMWRIPVALTVAGLLVVLLTLASTLNLYAHLAEFIRWTRTGPVVGSAGAADLTEILTEQQGLTDIVQLVIPTPLRYAAGSFFIGPAALILAVIGAVRARSQCIPRAFTLVMVVTIVIVFLSPARLVMLWTLIPGLSHTRHLSLLGTPLALSVAVLAAFGFESLMFQASVRVRPLKIITAFTAVIFVAGVTALGFLPLSTSWPSPALLAMIGLTAMLAIALPGLRSSPWRQAGAGLLVLLQLTFVYGSLTRSDGIPAVTTSPVWQSIEAGLLYIDRIDPNPGRIAIDRSVDQGDLSFLSAGSIVTYEGLPTFSHYTSPRIHWKFQHEIALAVEGGFAEFGGKYLLSSKPQPDSVGQQIFASGNIGVYRLKGTQRFVELFCISPDQNPVHMRAEGAAIGRLPTPDARSTELIQTIQGTGEQCEPPQRAGDVSFERSRNALLFSLPPGPERLLQFNLPPYAGWKLDIEKKSVSLFNLGDRRIVALVPAGFTGAAVLSYEPEAYLWRLRLSEVTWGLVIAAIMLQMMVFVVRSTLNRIY